MLLTIVKHYELLRERVLYKHMLLSQLLSVNLQHKTSLPEACHLSAGAWVPELSTCEACSIRKSSEISFTGPFSPSSCWQTDTIFSTINIYRKSFSCFVVGTFTFSTLAFLCCSLQSSLLVSLPATNSYFIHIKQHFLTKQQGGYGFYMLMI